MKWMTTKRMSVITAAVWLLGASLAGATGYTWTGAGDGKWWTNASNWGGSGYPSSASDTALINTGASIITNNTDLTLGALTLDTGFRGSNVLGGNLTISTSGGQSGNLTINAGTLQTAKDKTSGISVAGTYAIGAGGTTIVQRASTNNLGTGQTITAGTLTIAGNMNADSQGFNFGTGPGKGKAAGDAGSHGGPGGDYTPYTGVGPTYGSLINPTSLGSGGNDGGIGGGAIVIVVSGAVTVDGILSAAGQSTGTSSRAGAGGSINITAASLSGSGKIQANGGAGVNVGQGGGGRIAFTISGTDTFSGLISANSGAGNACPGGAGTIWLSQQKRDNLTLGGAGNMLRLRLGADDTMGLGKDTNYIFGAVTIQPGGILEMDGNTGLNVSGGVTNGSAAVLQVASLEVKGGGFLSATNLGFPVGRGPGYGFTGDGGSHGGRGADYVTASVEGTMGASYGSVKAPAELGSSCDLSGAGGGAILISASGAVINNGLISANGESAARGGSGGSIYIVASTLTGSGTNQANGGNGVNGCGAGGRVAVVLSSGTDFGSVVFQAYGGTNFTSGFPNLNGAPGTVYLEHANHASGKGDLIIDNNKNTPYIGSFTELSAGGDVVHDFERVIITNKGNLAIRAKDTLDFSLLNLVAAGPTNATLTLSATNGVVFPSSFTIFTNCTLCIDTSATVVGNWTIPAGAVLSHNAAYTNDLRKLNVKLTGNLTVETNGAIKVDCCGHPNGVGPGVSKGIASGGSYGGRGGELSIGKAGLTYGSITNPIDYGSGGDASAGSLGGGGVIILSVSGVLTNHGLISSSGAAIDRGGSGGAIKINASSLVGTGAIRANGGNAPYCGGGGRVALYLSSGSSLGGVTVEALGGTPTRPGAAGTVYVELPGQAPGRGIVRIDNTTIVGNTTNVYTDLPAKSNTLSYISELTSATLIVTNKSVVSLSTNLTVGDLFLKGSSITGLYLRGWTLTVNTPYHADWGSSNWLNLAGGQIVWKTVSRNGALIMIR